MKANKSKPNILAGVIFLLLFFVFLGGKNAQAASYDLYVDAGYKGDEKGTKEEPYNKISDAIEAKSGAKIYVKKGNYDEKVVMGKGTKIYGESRDKVIFSGGIEMKDGSLLNDITAESTIAVAADADAEISNCVVKNFGKIGIDAAPGSGKLTVKNSSIHDGSGKGIYVERGRKIEISGNKIYANGEEGVDVRAKVSGSIKNNQIYSNGESGIEIIIGSSDVLIQNNLLKKNGASGIAAQFYQETKKTGEINIEKNNISGNKKYGLDCALPSGGQPNSSYWNDSLNLVENDMENNGIKSVNDFCNILDAVDKTEEKVANKVDEKEEILSEEELKKKEESKRDEEIWENAEKISNYQDAISGKIDEQIEKINNQKSWRVFFFGVDEDPLIFIRKEIEINRGQLEELKNNLPEVKNEETKRGIEELAEKIENKSGELENFVRKKEKERGIFRKIEDFFKSIFGR